jgi:hypothetical protein
MTFGRRRPTATLTGQHRVRTVRGIFFPEDAEEPYTVTISFDIGSGLSRSPDYLDVDEWIDCYRGAVVDQEATTAFIMDIPDEHLVHPFLIFHEDQIVVSGKANLSVQNTAGVSVDGNILVIAANNRDRVRRLCKADHSAAIKVIRQ